MWTLVVFPSNKLSENDSVGLVPATWVIKPKNECWWPPVPASKLIQKLKPPQSHWSRIPIRIKKEGIVSYAEGLHLEQEAEYSTNAEEPDYRKGGRRIGKHVRRSLFTKPTHSLGLVQVSPTPSDKGSSSSSSSNNSKVLSDYEPLMTNEEFQAIRDQEKSRNEAAIPTLDNSTEQQQSSSFHHQASQHSSFGGPGHNVTPTSAFPRGRNNRRLPQERKLTLEEKIDKLIDRQAALEDIFLGAIAEIKNGITELLIRTTRNGEAGRSLLKDLIPFKFPLKDKKDFEGLEAWIRLEANYDTLVTFCGSFGGNEGGQVLRTILARLFAAPLAKSINWSGQNDKLEFKNTTLKNVVVDATKANENLSEKEKKTLKIEADIKNWFRNSRDLAGGKKKRSNVVISKSSKENRTAESSLNASASINGQQQSREQSL